MEKRALLAIVISLVVLIGYQYFFVKPVPPQKQRADTVRRDLSEKYPVQPEKAAEYPPKKTEPLRTAQPLLERTVKVETPLYTAEFSSKGAVIKQWKLKTYNDKQGLPVKLLKGTPDIAPLSIGRSTEFDLADLDFDIIGENLYLDENNPGGSLSFIHTSGTQRIKRELRFYADTYRVDMVEEVEGIGDYWITLGEDFGITGVGGYGAHIGPVLLMGAKRDEFKPGKIKAPITVAPDDLKWMALEDKYFFSSLAPLSDITEIKIWKKQASGLIAFNVKEGINRYVLYAGPKVIDELKPLNLGLEHIVDFGFFSIIARPIFWLLKFINGFIGNYGWSIIILTILLRIPFIPLLNKGQKSMKKLQALQPRMAEIKEKYKKDPQRMQKEMMELYKKYKVNPMGGCLPMLVQIPVFFALYKVLLIAVELRGAPFMLWVRDLSAKDPFYVLPIVMGVTMLVQQKMTPSSADPKQAKIMMFMPVVFTFMFLNFSSGLVLYWLMSNVLSIVQQYFVNKKVAREE